MRCADGIFPFAIICGFIPRYNNCQHVFIEGRTTLTNLLETLELWTRLIEHGSSTDAIYLDYMKAYDTVLHRPSVEKNTGR